MHKLKAWAIKAIYLGIALSMVLGLTLVAAPAISTVNAATSAIGINAYDAVTKLQNQISALPDSAFTNPNHKGMLLNKIEAVINQVENGAYNGAIGAINKLDNDIKGNIKKWVVASEQAALLASADVAIASVTNASKTAITISTGKLAGVDAGNNSWVWKGIPYAKPPVGELRWKAPVNPDPWQNVRHSTDTFTPALQPGMLPTWLPTNQIIGSEDCLYVNVFRPKADAANLPVYMWIHGGANYFGGAQNYDASLLASKENMVVVVIQYRLGPLGFLSHPALNPTGTQEDKSGNFGTLDTIKALKWVKSNIAFFGGNPDNITVSGQSAGGFNTMNIIISPLASGLLNKAFVLSAGGSNVPVATGVARANALIWKLLVLDGTCSDNTTAAAYLAAMTDAQIETYLRSKPGTLVERAAMNAKGSIDAAGPVIDGYVLSGTSASVIATGIYNKVPIVLGSTEYELKDFLPLYGTAIYTSTGKTWFNCFNVLGVIPPTMALTDVFYSYGDSFLYEACGKWPSLSWKAAAVDSIARLLKDNQEDDVYCYWFKWDGVGSDTPGFDFIYGAGHATDIPFFFGWNRDVFMLNSFSAANQGGRVALQNAMMSYLGAFAATGNPNEAGSGLLVWEQWSNTAGAAKSITFDATSTAANISMMNDEITKAYVTAQVNLLPWAVRYVVNMFMFF
jgi:para-nitrobenzyl esterase